MSATTGRPLARREFLVGSAALAGIGLAACSGATARRASGPTRSVHSHFGKVEVPAHPRRVVCLDQYSTLALLDIGVQPVATISGVDDWIPLRHRSTYHKLPKVGGYEADPEKILAARPDLILGNSAFTLSGGNSYDKLSEMAATVILTAATSGQWQRMALQAADAVNRAGPMHQLRDQYERRAREIGQRHARAVASNRFSLVAAHQNGQWDLCLPDSWSGVVLERVGCRFAAASRGRTGSETDQSMERLDILSDSTAILYQVNPDGGLDPAMRTVLDQEGFQALPAARSGHAVGMRNFYVFAYGQALGALDELDAVLTRL